MSCLLIDIGSHQFEQFPTYTGAKSARIVHAAVANYHHKQFPEFEDWGQVNLIFATVTSPLRTTPLRHVISPMFGCDETE